ncbi:MAG: PAS domain-containing protein [Hyphomicrobiales bacterium]|nr:PAS domain-containing protein [Hyphomicrobiales bacterium]
MNDEPAASHPEAQGEGTAKRFPTVGIGTSAGGVHALQTFFESLPDDVDAAFVVVVHLDPGHQSELPNILATRTRMPVAQVSGRVRLEPRHVYVIPPNRQLIVSDHHLAIAEFDEPRWQRAPIDLFFRSLAAQRGDDFAIILSGAGSDGSVGIKAVKEAGGIILVQDPDEAEYGSMPRSAVATGLADFILPLKEIAGRLPDLIRNRRNPPSDLLSETDGEVMQRILSHLRVRSGHDFSNYKKSTIRRRIARRMQVQRAATLTDYLSILRENAQEAQALFADLLISVTTFFRDSSAFERLAVLVIPHLFEDKGAADAIRVWIPGCATGEEAYSIAILLLEEASRHQIRRQVQVFATDLDDQALAVAREGRYPIAIEADITEDRMRRFFTREADQMRVTRELRDIVLFAKHSLLKDPPFSRVDLVSCRNVLIYLDRELQQQVCSTFHFALQSSAYLFVGSSENADSPLGMFRAIDREARIYQRMPTPTEVRLLPRVRTTGFGPEPLPARSPAPFRPQNEAGLHREALESLAPPSVIVDESYRVVHLSEQAGRYLQPSGGTLANDITELAREELRSDIRAALHRVFVRNEATLSGPIAVRFNGAVRRVYLQTKPLNPDLHANRSAIVFLFEGETLGDGPPSSETIEERAPGQQIQQLQQELQFTQAQLRASREEYEGANEELRAANEELQSINEEYRSTAEELETSKEELQSINEELQTVNTELKTKLESVSRAHSDVQNLMAATDVGILFLNSQLRINRFTPRITELFNIAPGDEGRPITDFTHRLDYDDLAADARKVLRDLSSSERELHSQDGNWFLTRLRPYRTVDDKIDGVVVTFVDIRERRRAEDTLREAESRMRVVVGELQHRTRNLIGVVMAMLDRTAGSDQTLDEFRANFRERLSALARVQGLLSRATPGEGVAFEELLASELSGQSVQNNRAVTLDGPKGLAVSSIAVQAFAMALHELTTNAIKHGALGQTNGRLNVRWRELSENGSTWIIVDWKESGVDTSQSAKRKGGGNGRRLIEDALPYQFGARTTFVIEPDGVRCQIALPVSDSLQEETK